MRIRRIDAAERPDLSVPLQIYGFHPSPPDTRTTDIVDNAQQYYRDNVTLIAEEGGTSVAEASAIPMRQNVRGTVYPMAGIAGVVSHPLARRRGNVRAVLVELLGHMRDAGNVVSALYPFRASFYQRFGFVGAPKTRTVAFSPHDLSGLLKADLPGHVTWERAAAGHDSYREFTEKLLTRRHGFALLPSYRFEQFRAADDRWLVTARAGDDVVGAMSYRILSFGGDLVTGDLLATGPLGRALLLRFLANHADQVGRIVMEVPPDELPELWWTDLAATIDTRVSYPLAPPPMARILSVDGLAGMAVGPGRLTVEVVDDPFIAGRYLLDGTTALLEITRDATASPAATLTAAGLSGLVYGILEPGDLVVRGFGELTPEAADQAALLFPRLVPHFYSRF